jgi:hypothetical protein
MIVVIVVVVMPVMVRMLTGENGIHPVAGFFFSGCGDGDQGRRRAGQF